MDLRLTLRISLNNTTLSIIDVFFFSVAMSDNNDIHWTVFVDIERGE